MSVRTGPAPLADRLMSRRSALGLGALLGTSALVLAACGDDEPDASSTATSTSENTESSTSSSSSASEAPAAGGTQTLAVDSVDFSYELPQDTFSAGTYEITVTNRGNATHDLIVERDGADVEGSDQIGPGESSTFEVTLEEGDYVFYCSVGNHRQMGMEVPVTVTA